MPDLLQAYGSPLLIFLLVLTRISGLIMTAPIYGSRSVPVKVRAILAIGLAILVTPLYLDHHPGWPENLVGLTLMLVREGMLGLSLGLAVLILFAGLQVAGYVMGQMSGMQLADVVSPGFDTSVPVFAQVLDLVTMMMFIAIGGHRQVLGALLDTFRWMPPGKADVSREATAALVDVVQYSFAVGIRTAAPVMISLLLSVMILGLISRTLPQLNVLAVGFSLNSILLLLTLGLSVGAAAWIFQDYFDAVLQTMAAAFATSAQ